VGVVPSQVEVSALGRSFVQRSPTECCVSECDRKASIMRKSWPTMGCYAKRGAGGGGIYYFVLGLPLQLINEREDCVS